MRKIFITAFISLFYSLSTLAQNDKKEDEPIKLNEIIVTATRVQKNLKNVPITVQVVTAEDIRKSQATDFQSFLETEFAGINFTYDGGMPNINMMGFGGKYVLFLMDGERMEGETFDNIDYNRIDLDNIERIEIIKGASSSLYGSNALGGVINIITKNAKKPFEGSLNYQYESIKSHKVNIGVSTKQRWCSIRLTSFYNFREPYVLEDSEPLTVYKNGTAVTSEKGELNIKKEPLDAHDLLVRAISHLQVMLEERKGVIRTHFLAENSDVSANESHLTNVFINVIENAIKYSPKPPIIDVYTENVKNKILIRIKDRGQGMSRQAMKQLFTKFYREHTGDLHNVKGHGLGLAYVKSIVQYHQGTISVESEKGKGSTFFIKLPVI